MNVSGMTELGFGNGNGVILHNGGTLITDQLAVRNISSFTFSGSDIANDLFITGGGNVTTANVGNLTTFAFVLDGNSKLNLSDNLVLSGDLLIRGTGGTQAIVDANGFDITANNIDIGQFGNHGDIINRGIITANNRLGVSGGTFSLNATDVVAQQVGASNGGTLNLHANTAAQSAIITTGGIVNTAATGNLATFAFVQDGNTKLNLGDNLVLSGDLLIRGTGGTQAIVDANSFDITADRILLGQFNNTGELINDGMIIADELIFDQSDLLLTGGGDTIGSVLDIVDNSVLTVQQALGEVNGLTFNGSALQIDATSQMNLVFDGQLNVGLDWAFRWLNPGVGDRVGDLTSLVNNGRIVLSSSNPVSIFDGGDGFTYVGSAAIPEPAALGMLMLASVICLSWRRRVPGRV